MANHTITSYRREGDSRYPEVLRSLHRDAPAMLEVEGLLADSIGQLGPSVAIVGTREPPDWAIPYTTFVAEMIARAGGIVISGGANGIDLAAHDGALAAPAGGTIAIVAGGIDRLSPLPFAQRAEAIRARGAIVALAPRGAPSFRFRFFARNAVIAALASHVVMIAAPHQSGAKNTLAYARRLGRTRWVGPRHEVDPRTHGCGDELDRGALALDERALLSALGLPSEGPRWADVGAARIAEYLAGESKHPTPTPRPSRTAKAQNPRQIEPETLGSILPIATERAVLSALRLGPESIDSLVLACAASVPSLRALLLTWTVEGIVRERSDGRFELANA